MASQAKKFDRKKVDEFFEWESNTRNLKVLGGAFIVLAITSKLVGFPSGLIIPFMFLIVGGGLLYKAFTSVLPAALYENFKAVRNSDLSRALIRAYRKTETNIDSLLDFDALDLVSLDPASMSSDDRSIIERLHSKSVYLIGKHKNVRQKLLSVDGRAVVEYSPIFVSILFLTRYELIVYFANIEISKGDLLVEEVNRLFLKDIVEITSGSTTERIKRADNTALFDNYEKSIKTKLPDEIVTIDFSIRVTKTDGRTLNLPVGAPEYRDGTHGALDAESDEDSDRFTRVAREIFKRINDAKARI